MQPPPENLAIGTTIHSQGTDIGYVIGLSYFTPAQINDVGWEFKRIQRAQWRYCPGETRFIHRDVRWATPGPSGNQCAMVIYTMRCVNPLDEDDEEATPIKLEEARARLLEVLPPGRPEENCGEKDADVRAAQRAQ